MAKFFEKQVKPSFELEALFDLGDSVEVGLFYFLIHIELILDGRGVWEGVGFENISAIILEGDNPFNDFASLGFENLIGFEFVFDHGYWVIEIKLIRYRWSKGGKLGEWVIKYIMRWKVVIKNKLLIARQVTIINTHITLFLY